jgi:plasmid stability protein
MMSTLQIRNLPDDVYREIKKLSEREHRSLSSQALALLEQALDEHGNRQKKRRAIIEEIRASEENWPEKESLPDPGELLAEDRKR